LNFWASSRQPALIWPEKIFELSINTIVLPLSIEALGEVEAALLTFEIPITEMIGSGGGETKGTQRLRQR